LLIGLLEIGHFGGTGFSLWFASEARRLRAKLALSSLARYYPASVKSMGRACMRPSSAERRDAETILRGWNYDGAIGARCTA
jgi:hypothetical protein